MTDTATAPPRRGFRLWPRSPAIPHNRYTEAALERHKREGQELAVKARWIAMALIAVLLVYLNPHWDVLYYHGILALIAFNGWLIRRVGQVERSRAELALIFLDLLIMTVGMVLPNPLSHNELPLAMQYRLDYFLYFFVILAAGTLAFSWRTVIVMGIWTAAMWAVALAAVWWFSDPVPGLSQAASVAFADFPGLSRALDPNSLQIELRIQEIVVFVLVAFTLGFSVRRFNRLLLNNAGLERERANLSRYFSPNVVEELSQNDEPLKQTRSHDIAVLFVDIVGFTRYSADCDPNDVIAVLRGFHARMEAAVFRHGGTLDKYLGDGLMATFGTPVAGEHDATDALDCARAMLREMEAWNRERRHAGRSGIEIGVGIHYGPAVLGDIGANRLEYAVIGTTVNISSRLERLTRDHGVRLVMSDALRARVLSESGPQTGGLSGFTRLPDQRIRGIEDVMTVWALG
ncbi:MAG: adenylate/guanylate cyclase domain-containing protein [Jhaorihella sp.]